MKAESDAARFDYRKLFLVTMVILLLLVASTMYLLVKQGGSSSTVTVTSTANKSQLDPELASVVVAETVDTYQNSAPIRIAIQHGIFSSLGLNVTMIATLNLFPALASGQVGFAMSEPPFIADAAGADIIALGTTMTNYPGAIIAQPGIKSLQYLNGKTWGCSSLGQLTCMMPYLLIKSQNWTYSPDLIKPIGTTNTIIAAMEKNDIQAFVFNYATAIQLQSEGEANILGDMRSFVPNWYPTNVLTTRQFASAHPNTVRLFLTGIYKGIAWITENPNATIAWMMNQYQMTAPAAQAVYHATQFSLTGTIDSSVYQFMYDTYRSQGNLPSFDWQSTYDPEYLPSINYEPS